jgi:hypothetical protein
MREIRVGLFVPVVLLTMCGAVLAQSQPAVTMTPVVPTGKMRQVGFYTSINPDCSNTGDIDARITQQPQQGTVELEQGAGFSFFHEKNPRSACNTRQVQGIKVKYTSKDGFTGKDTFEVEFLTPAGGDIVWKYSVTVK